MSSDGWITEGEGTNLVYKLQDFQISKVQYDYSFGWEATHHGQQVKRIDDLLELMTYCETLRSKMAT